MSLVFNPFTGTFDFIGGGGGMATTPALPFTSVQFNNAGGFGGSADFTWSGTTGLDVEQAVQIGTAGAGITTTTPGALLLGNGAFDYGEGASFANFNWVLTPNSDSLGSTGRVYASLVLQPSVDTSGATVFENDGYFGGGHNFQNIWTKYTVFRILDAGTTVTAHAAAEEKFPFLDKGTVVTGLVAMDYTNSPNTSFGSGAAPAITQYFDKWVGAIDGISTNAYYLWLDSAGVYRIKADNTFNAVYQAITALYNPQFTKYTPGAVNYERIVQQWESNVATLTTEAGGTGTLRALNLGDVGVQVQVNGKNLTLAGNLTTSGAFASTFTMTNTTGVTFPTSGTLATTSQIPSGAALTKGDDTNVTLTLGGSASTALVNAASITAGWAGTLSVARGGSGAGTLTGLVLGNGTSAFTTVTAPSGTVVGTSDTQTLTNKRITKRVTTASDATSITPNSDNADITYQANTQAAGTLTINADGGTPTNGQGWVLKIKSTNVQTFSWNAIYVGGAVPLPTTTSGSSKIDYFAFVYDTVTPKWDYTGPALGY